MGLQLEQLRFSSFPTPCRDFKLYSAVPCLKWAVIFSARDEQDTENFVGELKSVSGGLGFQMAHPLKCKVGGDGRVAAVMQEVAKVNNLIVLATSSMPDFSFLARWPTRTPR